jgi:hypothetical protein
LRALHGSHQALLLRLGILDGTRSDFHGGGAQFGQRTDGDARGRRDAAGLGHRFRRRQVATSGLDEIHQRGERLVRVRAFCADPQLVAFARPQAQDAVDAVARGRTSPLGRVFERHARLIVAGQANELRRGARVEAETVGEGDFTPASGRGRRHRLPHL